jgi:hypothetical protein
MADRKLEKRVKARFASEPASSGIPEFDTILKGEFSAIGCLQQGPPGSAKKRDNFPALAGATGPEP